MGDGLEVLEVIDIVLYRHMVDFLTGMSVLIGNTHEEDRVGEVGTKALDHPEYICQEAVAHR